MAEGKKHSVNAPEWVVDLVKDGRAELDIEARNLRDFLYKNPDVIKVDTGNRTYTRDEILNPPKEQS